MPLKYKRHNGNEPKSEMKRRKSKQELADERFMMYKIPLRARSCNINPLTARVVSP